MSSEEAKDSAPITQWACTTSFEFEELPELDSAAKVEDDSVPLEMMSVGREFLLRCSGEPVIFNRDDVKLIQTTDKPFMLKLLKVERIDERSADLIMTSYQAGKHKIENAHISDGKQIVQLQPMELTVASVLQPQKDGKPPQPYAAYGPFELGWPIYLWIGLGLVVAAIIGAIVASILGSSKRRRLKRELREYKTALSSYDQFNKELRQLKRGLDFEELGENDSWLPSVVSLERSLRLYFVREFEMPALEWQERQIIRELKKRHRPIYDYCKRNLQITFREMSKTVNVGKNVSLQDVRLLLNLSQKTISEVEREQKKRRRDAL